MGAERWRAAEEAMQDLVLTAVRATVAMDRQDWEQVLAAAKRLEEHGMRLAALASRRLAAQPAVGALVNAEEVRD